LIRTIMRPHEGHAAAAATRFFIDGPTMACGERAMNGIALVFHELATNAAKYGALTADEGQIDIRWRTEDGKAIFSWGEQGGPVIGTPPNSTGFGSLLAQRTVVGQFGGTMDCEWRPAGLAVTITLPLASLSS
jgi:two-component sensor histidine kinase